MAQALNDALGPWGITAGQFAQLLTLYEEDGLTAADLSRAVGIEPATMTRTLQRMERDGLIRREPDPDDARRQRIRLTDRAWSIEAEVKAAAGRINEVVLAGLPPADRERLLSDLDTAIDRAQRTVGPRPTGHGVSGTGGRRGG